MNKKKRHKDGGWNHININDRGSVEYGSLQEPS